MNYQAEVTMPSLKEAETTQSLDFSLYNIQPPDDKLYRVPRVVYPKLDLNLTLLRKEASWLFNIRIYQLVNSIITICIYKNF